MALEYVSEILLPRLLAASVQSTLLVAVVWTLCRMLPRLPAAARCWLWWLVALQLVVGVLWSSPLALPLLPAGPDASAMLAPLQPLASPRVANAVAVLSALPPPDGAALASPPSPAWSWPLAFAVLWLLGLSAMITRSLLGYQATRRLLKESVPCRDTSLVQALKLAADAHGLRSTPRLRLSSAIQSPQLIGPWRPVLMLPARQLPLLTADELDMALTHELTHLQRRDLWWGLLPALAQHLFFFHPLAHLAAREYAFAREAACDAAVLIGNPRCAGEYGRLLVRLGVAARPSAGLASASPTFLVLKRRLLMLQQTALPLRASALALTAAVALFGVVPYRVTAKAAMPVPTPMAAPVSAPMVSAMPAPKPAPLAIPTSASLAVPAAMASTASSAAAASAAIPAAPPAPAPLPPPAHAAPSPPTPPAPPTPPVKSEGMRFSHIWTDDERGGAYVMIDGNTTNAVGTTEDLHAAKSQQRNGEPLLWVRKGGARYVVRDAATLRRVKELHAPIAKLGEEQGRLGEQQGALGAKQGELGARQGELGAQEGELAARYAAAAVSRSAADADRLAAEQRRAGLAEKHRQLAQQQQELAKRQQALGRQQQALGERQRVASEAAHRETERLIDAAIANGLAQRVP